MQSKTDKHTQVANNFVHQNNGGKFMKHVIFNQQDAENIEPPKYDDFRPSEKYHLVDSPFGFAGLYLKVAQLSRHMKVTNPNGNAEQFKRLWYLRYTIGKQSRKYLLGDLRVMNYDEACRKHAELAERVRQGEDVVATFRRLKAEAAAKPKIVAFETVAIDWLASKESQVKSYTYYQISSRLNKHIIPFFRNMTCDSITSQNVIAFRNKVFASTPAMSTPCLSYVRQILNHAFENNLCERNVAKDVSVKHKQVRRNAWFKDEDIKRIWERLEADDIPANIGRVIKLLALTGLRRNGIVALKKSEVLLSETGGAVINLEGDRMKQGIAFKVFLDKKTVTELLQPAIDDSRDSDYIFPATRRGSSGHISPINVSQYFKQVVDELGISGVLHSWRSSLISGGLELGFDGSILDSMLAHAPSGTQAIYQRSWNYPKMFKVWGQWQSHVWNIAEGRALIISEDAKILHLVK